jgi:hypothetical protein
MSSINFYLIVHLVFIASRNEYLLPLQFQQCTTHSGLMLAGDLPPNTTHQFRKEGDTRCSTRPDTFG